MLGQNYPNPFNPSTIALVFSCRKQRKYHCRSIDAIGREIVQRSYQDFLPAGTYDRNGSATAAFASGIYISSDLPRGILRRTGQMVLMK
jgi:hypothetical protein